MDKDDGDDFGMRGLIVGASAGLGRAILEGLTADGHEIIGVSRRRPDSLRTPWIEADFKSPAVAARVLAEQCPENLDTIIWNLGVWEPKAFTPDYLFETQSEELTEALVATNLTGPILTLRALMPRLLQSPSPRVILTGSTSGLPRSGRPEVAFGATKAALNGIADSLREIYRNDRLGVTTLQLGDLNTEDDLNEPRDSAAARGGGTLVPVHDVVEVVRLILGLSASSFIREIVMPPILDERF